MRTFLKSFIEKRPAVHRIYAVRAMVDRHCAISRNDFISHMLCFINSWLS